MGGWVRVRVWVGVGGWVGEGEGVVWWVGG